MIDFLGIADDAIDVHGAMQKRTELAAFLCLLHSHFDERYPTIWEIGTATGGTLWALASVFGEGSCYVSIDLPGGPHGGAQCLPDAALHDLIRDAGASDFQVVRGNSLTVGISRLGPRPDLLLIDGDHSERGVRRDWERYEVLVRPGIIALHDILPHPPVSGVEVEPVWNEIVASEPNTVEIVDRRPASHGGQWGGIGVVFR
jgi:predicted O-methyltransferase YrrM